MVRVSSQACRVWALYGARTGDNRQIAALAEALGWLVEEKRLTYNRLYKAPNLLIGASLRTLTADSRQLFHPPWPDLIIAAGRRSVAPALWVKSQSGGRTKLVHLGRPRAPLNLFDLLITTAQYGLPSRDNVLSLSLPMGAPGGGDDQDIVNWQNRLAGLPRPWTGVLVGGTTWPYVIDRNAAEALASDLNRWIARTDGSAVITTSPRSGRAVAAALETKLEIPHHLHVWDAAAPNPYNAILELADRLIVTSDSVSMLADACRAEKPLAIWDTRRRRDPISRAVRALGREAAKRTPTGDLLRALTTRGVFWPPRDVERVIERIIASNCACRFNPALSLEKPRCTTSRADEMQTALDRVRALLGQ